MPSDAARIHGCGRRLVPVHNAAARAMAAMAINSGSRAVAKATPAATPATHHGAREPMRTITATPTPTSTASVTG